MKILIALVLAATLAACASGESSSSSASSASSEGGAPGTVSVVDFAFDPETVSVAAGEEITWTVAEDAGDHTVKFEDEESDVLAAGDTYSRTFDETGEFKYVCGIHPQMTGTVSVE